MEKSPIPLISADDQSTLRAAIADLGLLSSGESIRTATRAGEGNMNLVLRVETDRQSLIVKQSRPWVEKYPTIAAPIERIAAEIQFYRQTSSIPAIAEAMPNLLAADESSFLVVLQDLGPSSDYTDLYQRRDPTGFPLRDAVHWLAQLHAVRLEPDHRQIGCRPLLELNHAHIFEIPLRSPSAIPLDDVCAGLEEAAAEIRSTPEIASTAASLGQIYLGESENGCLLHGDFYPGSWLRTSGGLRVIDPEFCFVGPPEFDLGVLIAHSIMTGHGIDAFAETLRIYQQTRPTNLDSDLLHQFVGIEIIRRLIGVAQLPLQVDIRQRKEWLEMGRQWLCQ